MEVVESPTDEELVQLYRRATIFALATRTRIEKRVAYGEGFGIVLAEAQLVGVPVIAPTAGGSSDAFVDGLTGRRPTDESPGALAMIIEEMIADHEHLAVLSANAKRWAAATCAPEKYGLLVERALLATGATS